MELISPKAANVLALLLLLALFCGFMLDNFTSTVGRHWSSVQPVNSTDKGCPDMCVTQYCCCYRSGASSFARWAPTMSVNVTQKLPAPGVEVHAMARFESAVGTSRWVQADWVLDDGVRHQMMPEFGGVRIAPGRPVVTTVTLSTATPLNQSCEETFIVLASALSYGYLLGASCCGVVFGSVTLVVIPHFMWRVRHNAGPRHPAHGYAILLNIFLLLYILPIGCAASLPAARNRATGLLLGLIVYQLPHVFIFFLQGFLWVRIGSLVKKDPDSPNQVTAVVVWTTVLTTQALAYAFIRRPEDLTDVVGEGIWDLMLGNEASNPRAPRRWSIFVFSLTHFLAQLFWAFAAAYRCVYARSRYRHRPSLPNRHRLVELQYLTVGVGVVIILMLVRVPSHVLYRSPLGVASFGGMIHSFTLVHALTHGYQPSFIQGDDSKPPSPHTPHWMLCHWKQQWMQWALKNPGALSLYYFERSEDETRWYEIQGISTPVSLVPEKTPPELDYCSTAGRVAVLFTNVLLTPAIFAILAISVTMVPLMIFGVGIPGLVWLSVLWRRLARAHAAQLIRARRGLCVGAAPCPLDAIRDEGTWKDKLRDPRSYRSLLYLVASVPITLSTGMVSVFFFVASGLLLLPLVTLPIALPFLRLCTRIIYAMTLLGEKFALQLLGKPIESPARCEPLLRRQSDVGVRVPTFKPFCIETCSILLEASYEAYRLVPEFTDMDVTGRAVGWVPGKGGSAGTVARMVPLSKQTERSVDVAPSGLRLRCVAHISGVQVLVAWTADQSALVVAFRGTKSLANKRVDLDVLREPWEQMQRSSQVQALECLLVCGCCVGLPRVHRGFVRLWESMQEQVLGIIDRYTPRGSRIFVTGHSLGAALASLCSYTVSRQRPMLDLVLYSFGTPLLGNQAFARGFGRVVTGHFLVWNERDAIMRGAGTCGNAHPGYRTSIGRFGQIVIAPSLLQLWNPWGAARSAIDPGFVAHRIVRYQAAITTAITLMELRLRTSVGEEDAVTDPLAWAPDNTGFLLDMAALWNFYVIFVGLMTSVVMWHLCGACIIVSLALLPIGGVYLLARSLMFCRFAVRLQLRIIRNADPSSLPLTPDPLRDSKWWVNLCDSRSYTALLYCMLCGPILNFAVFMVTTLIFFFTLLLSLVPVEALHYPLAFAAELQRCAVDNVMKAFAERIAVGCSVQKRDELYGVQPATTTHTGSDPTTEKKSMADEPRFFRRLVNTLTPVRCPSWLHLGALVEVWQPFGPVEAGELGRVVSVERRGSAHFALLRFRHRPPCEVPLFALRIGRRDTSAPSPSPTSPEGAAFADVEFLVSKRDARPSAAPESQAIQMLRNAGPALRTRMEGLVRHLRKSAGGPSDGEP